MSYLCEYEEKDDLDHCHNHGHLLCYITKLAAYLYKGNGQYEEGTV